MEIQLKAKSKKAGVVTLCYLFEVYDQEHNEFLIDLGFAASNLKKIKAYNETKTEVKIGMDISLYRLLDKKDKYLMYEGQSMFDSCEPSLVFVSTKLSWMSRDQHLEVKGDDKLKQTVKRGANMIVYQNIHPTFGQKPFILNTSSVNRPKFPVSFDLQMFMYNPADNETLGLIGPYSIPGWETPNGTLYQPDNLPELPVGLKYLVFYYEPLYRSDYAFIPRYIIVPEGFAWTKGLQPSFVPLVIRSNIPEALGNIRALVTLKIGVAKIDLNLIETWQRNQLEAKEAAKKKAAEELQKLEEVKEEQLRQRPGITGNNSTSNLTSPEAGKQPSTNELENLKKASINWERQCVRWALQSIVNRHYENEEAWDLQGVWNEGNSDIYKCVEWQDKRMGPSSSEVTENSGIFGSLTNLTNQTSSPTSPSSTNSSQESRPAASADKPASLPPKLNVQKCGLYISIILNKNFHDAKFKDLVENQCGSEMPSLTQVRS
jgi:hypothetical protein